MKREKLDKECNKLKRRVKRAEKKEKKAEPKKSKRRTTIVRCFLLLAWLTPTQSTLIRTTSIRKMNKATSGWGYQSPRKSPSRQTPRKSPSKQTPRSQTPKGQKTARTPRAHTPPPKRTAKLHTSVSAKPVRKPSPVSPVFRSVSANDIPRPTSSPLDFKSSTTFGQTGACGFLKFVDPKELEKVRNSS